MDPARACLRASFGARHRVESRGLNKDFFPNGCPFNRSLPHGARYLAIGNLGMLYLRGDGVKVDKIAGLALLLQSAAMDSSPENHAKQNLSTTRGLTAEIVAAAQALSAELGKAKNLLIPLDQYLNTTTTNAAGKLK